MSKKDNQESNPLRVIASAESCGASPGGSYLGCSLPPDRFLLEQGWQRRFIGDARMARDAVDNYTAMGFEVRLEALNADELRDDCSGCKAMFSEFKAVYTRKRDRKQAS